MKVKPLGKTHVLLIFTAAEAQYFGIPVSCGCALILRTHAAFFPDAHCCRKRYRVRTMPQVFHLESCSDMMGLVERLYRLQLKLPPCRLFAGNGGYDLILRPTCRQFFLLRSLCGEYGVLTGNTRRDAAAAEEHGTLLCSDILRKLGPHLVTQPSDE